MAGKTRSKAAGYHGVQNMKFAPKKSGTYDTALLDMKYAQSINPSALLEAAEQYADNRLVCRVPSDTGYEGEVGTTAPDPELEKAAGFALEGANGLITTNIASYLRGALYYEFLEAGRGRQAVCSQVLDVQRGDRQGLRYLYHGQGQRGVRRLFLSLPGLWRSAEGLRGY